MPARVLVIAFDAAEATLVERWAAEGMLPAFAGLAASGTTFELTTPIDSLPDAVWPEIVTGRRCAAIGWCWYHGQIFAGEARRRPIRPGDFDVVTVWEHASRAGRRVAALDVPLTGPCPGLNGVALREWGAHDTPYAGMSSDPPEFLDEVRSRFGEHPLPHRYGDGTRCDDHDGAAASLELLRRRLLEGAGLKTGIVCDVLEREQWDLVFASFSESHCAGHHYWHLADRSSPWHEEDAAPALRNALRDVYRRLDACLGDLVDAAGDGATVLVLLTHGMGPNRGGWQVLPDVLGRLGYASGRLRARSLRQRLPRPVRTALRATVRGDVRRRLQETAGSLHDPLESPATRAAALPNAPCGAIRLNVRGRDPFGSVERGEAYDEACAELIQELEALESLAGGTRAVESVVRAVDLLGEPVHPNVPDLLVRFSRDQPLIPGVRSPRIGTVSGPVYRPGLPRTGEHEPESRLYVRGPGIPGGRVEASGHVLDVTPTLLHVLGVPLPEDLDGRPLALQADADA